MEVECQIQIATTKEVKKCERFFDDNDNDDYHDDDNNNNYDEGSWVSNRRIAFPRNPFQSILESCSNMQNFYKTFTRSGGITYILVVVYLKGR